MVSGIDKTIYDRKVIGIVIKDIYFTHLGNECRFYL